MRSNLELLLLSLISDGLQTPYELKARTDLSLGSTVPALARLHADGFVKASDIQTRRSRRFTLTAKGAKVLEKECLLHLQDTPTDVESAIRIAYLALRYGHAASAADILRRVSDSLLGQAITAKAEATSFTRHEDVISPAMLRRLRAQIEGQRLEGSAQALLQLANDISSLAKGGIKKTKNQRIR